MFDNITNSINAVIAGAQQIALPAMVLCIVACGALFISGRRGADAAKPWLLYIFAGGILIFGALTIANWIQTTTTF